MKLGREVLDHLAAYSTDEQFERCGIIVTKSGVTSFIEVPNHHFDKRRRFTIVTRDVKRALRAHEAGDRDLVGFFHTHPGPDSMRRPSTRDLWMAGQLSSYLHAVYHPYSGALIWYDGTGIVGEDLIITALRRKGQR